MDNKDYENIIEAILFSNGDPVSVKEISKVLSIEVEKTQEIIEHMREKQRGICIKKIENSYQMCTNPEYYDHIVKLREKEDVKTLSQAAYETLSIIAYNKTATRAKIESIRGVNSGSSIMTLMEKGLIEEKGRVEAPGRPVIFGTTQAFLRAFDMEKLDDLIPIEFDVEEEEINQEEDE